MRTAREIRYDIGVAVDQIRHEVLPAFVAQSLIGLSRGYSESFREQAALQVSDKIVGDNHCVIRLRG
jgi:hypothetical protein